MSPGEIIRLQRRILKRHRKLQCRYEKETWDDLVAGKLSTDRFHPNYAFNATTNPKYGKGNLNKMIADTAKELALLLSLHYGLDNETGRPRKKR